MERVLTQEGSVWVKLTSPPGREASPEQTSHQTAPRGQQQGSIPERLEVWEQEGLACSGVSSWECPLAGLVPRAAPRWGCPRSWAPAACSSAALELAEEAWGGSQGSQSPVQKSHKSSCNSTLCTRCDTCEDLWEGRKYCLQHQNVLCVSSRC